VRPRLLIMLALVVAVLLAVVIWFYPSNRDFGPANSSWNGLSNFVAEFEVSAISSLESLPTSPQGTALVVIAYSAFADPELESLKRYVESGGTLVILDDYGHGNQILDYLGVEPRFTNDPLLDPLFNYRNGSLPKVTQFAHEPPISGVDAILLNHASSLSGVSEDDVIAWSSRFSFLDQNGNSVWDEGEPVGPLAVACSMSYEDGYIVLISDPSILINSMLEMEDNRLFVENFLAAGGTSPQVIVDGSHLPPSPLEGAKDALGAVRSALETPQGTVGLALAMLVLMLAPVWRKNRGNEGGGLD